MNSGESTNFATDVRLLASRALDVDRRVGEGVGGRRRGRIWSDDVGNHEPVDLRSSWNAYRSSQRLMRSRSTIRTNPWIGSAAGDPLPRSPGQTSPPPPQSPSLPPPPPLMSRSWSMVETGKTPTPTKAPPRVSTDGFNNSNNGYSNNNNNKYQMYRYSREDSLLTTSIETDSFCASEFSDAETTTSLTSFGDVCLTPTEGDDWRPSSDVISYDPPTKMTAGSRRAVHCMAGCGGDGVEYEGGKFLYETLNTEKIRKIRWQPVDISSFSSSGFKHPGVERSSEVNWEEQVSKSVETKGGGGGGGDRGGGGGGGGDCIIVTPEQFRVNSEAQTKANLVQRTTHSGCSKVDEPFCDSAEPKRANGSLKRGILSIRSGLQDKVALLKHEKRVVDQKIREAKEEERIRIRQLEKFRQQLAQTRREILLRTLEDIKRTLAQQVLRLQKVYDFVLLEQ